MPARRFWDAKVFRPASGRNLKLLVYGCTGTWLVLFGTQLLIPLYSGAFCYGDWWMHFDIAQIFRGERDRRTVYFDTYTIASRTPLFNLFTAYYLTLFGNRFSIAQLVAIVPSVYLFLVLARYCRRSTIPLCALGLAFSPLFNHMGTYPWPKVLSTLFVMSALWFSLQARREGVRPRSPQTLVMAGGLWGCSFMTHTSTVLFALAVIFDWLWHFRNTPATALRTLLVPCGVALLVGMPWCGWGIIEFGLREFFSAGTAVAGPASSASRFMDAGSNAVATLIPFPLLVSLLKMSTSHGYSLERFFNCWLRFYYSTLPGALTVVGTYCLVRQMRMWRSGKLHHVIPTSLVLCWICFGFLGGCLLQPGLHTGGLAGEGMIPLVTILFLIAAEPFARLAEFKPVIVWVALLEIVWSRGLHLYAAAAALPFIWDRNMPLKTDHGLVFARDEIGGVLPAVGLLVCGVAVLLRMRSEERPDEQAVPAESEETLWKQAG